VGKVRDQVWQVALKRKVSYISLFALRDCAQFLVFVISKALNHCVFNVLPRLRLPDDFLIHMCLLCRRMQMFISWMMS
jgi:hypothetical protein